MKLSRLHSKKLLIQYLADHFAASVGGIELAKRCRRQNKKGKLGVFLSGFIQEIEAEHDLLQGLIESLGASPSRFKMGAIWLAEKMGRLKFNQSIFHYSDLSRLFELETLLSGVQAKVDMWRIIAKLDTCSILDATFLERQGNKQLSGLKEHCLQAGLQAFSP